MGKRGQVGTPPRDIEPPPRDIDATVRKTPAQTRGQTPPSQSAPRPGEGAPTIPVAPPSPGTGKLRIRGLFQRAAGALTATPRRRRRPGPQGGESPCQGAPRTPRPRPGAGRGGCVERRWWPRSPRAACRHSPSARPLAAPTAARKRSICVFFLLSGSHITWHSRISSRPARGCLDMAAAGAACAALGPGTGLGAGPGRQAGRRGPGAAGQPRGPGTGSATERSAGAVRGIPGRPRPHPAPPLSGPAPPRVTLRRCPARKGVLAAAPCCRRDSNPRARGGRSCAGALLPSSPSLPGA